MHTSYGLDTYRSHNLNMKNLTKVYMLKQKAFIKLDLNSTLV